MGRFTRTRGKIMLGLDSTESELLAQSITELVDLLDESPAVTPEPETETDQDDPFAAWERSFGREPGIEDELVGAETDPITRRLFPLAYPDDPQASSDFSRFTEPDQRRAKIEAACTVLDDLDALHGGSVRIKSDHVDAWLKTLNTLRLALSVLLDINDEVSHSEAAQRPDDDSRAWLYQFYGWLGWMLESLLECLLDAE